LVFYNVENLTDPSDDPVKDDDAFTPGGEMHWTPQRLERKAFGIFRVLSHIGAGELPAIVCLAEVENRWVLQYLVSHTPLSAGNYRIVHQDAPDRRGMDVALLLRSAGPQYLGARFIRVSLSGAQNPATRDILYARFRAPSGDTLHLFVNHWPSRSGGTALTEPLRLQAASVLHHHTDSIFDRNPAASVVVTGDFNYGPEQKSLREVLGAVALPYLGRQGSPGGRDTSSEPTALALPQLYNLMLPCPEPGTYKYQGIWECIDQIILSGSMLVKDNGWTADPEGARVFHPEYLLEEDKQFMGKKPFRSYTGPRYHGGYSDHLPVYMDITAR